MASFAETFGVPVGEKTKTWLPLVRMMSVAPSKPSHTCLTL